jgi:dihydrolipoamide dehydrogenase
MTDPNVIEHVDVAVIGGGPGGYTAAFRCADLGMEVAVIDDSPSLGGVCLNRGCIPSKALLNIARIIHEADEAAHWGLKLGPPKIVLDEMKTWKNKVVSDLVGGIGQLCSSRGVKQITGRAVFIDSKTIRLEKSRIGRLNVDRCIIASGSLPIIPKPFRIGSDKVWDSTDALNVPVIPERLLVIGAGYIGLELGTVYSALGSKVTVVELAPTALPGVDQDLVGFVQKKCERFFHELRLNTKVEGLKDTGKEVEVTLQNADGSQETIPFDRVLISIGRSPNSRGMGLENTKVEIDEKGFIKVNQQQRTSDPNLWAIGDVVGQPMLAHKASREGQVAAEDMAGHPAAFDNSAIPAVVFTDPELAWCGLTEREAKERDLAVQVARFPWAASGRAKTLDRADGVTKIIFDPDTGRVLGVGIVGPHAGELIAEGVLAVEMAALASDLAGTIHAHPTLSETVMESAEQFFGPSTHMYRKKQPRK